MQLLEHVLLDESDSLECYEALDRADDDERLQLLALADHPDPQVRRAMVSLLPHAFAEPPQAVLEVAIQLTTDMATKVRDWACFVLAEQWREVDTPALRKALAARLDDLDRDTRCEPC